jgi:hypothetical protein
MQFTPFAISDLFYHPIKKRLIIFRQTALLFFRLLKIIDPAGFSVLKMYFQAFQYFRKI